MIHAPKMSGTMSDLCLLTDEQMVRLRPFFPKSHGKPKVDDRRNSSQSLSHGTEPAGQQWGRGRLIGRTKGGVNTKLHAITRTNGRLTRFCNVGRPDQRTYHCGNAT